LIWKILGILGLELKLQGVEVVARGMEAEVMVSDFMECTERMGVVERLGVMAESMAMLPRARLYGLLRTGSKGVVECVVR
jgi:CRISPR/Cas system-associated exonuclease Cas4 (RecB family)